QATAIGYRLIHDNLPKFYDACLLYEKIREKFTDLEFVIEEEWLQELGVTTLDELLTPIAYSHLLTQKTIDAYNKLLGGYSTPEGTKVKGLNEQINLYRQDKGLKARELPTFALLFKQILSEHESASFIPEAFENDKELLDAIFAFVNRNKSEESNIRKIEESFSAIDSDENTKVYIQPKSLTELSNAIFGNWSVIGDALDRYAQEYIGRKSDKEKFLKQNFYPIDTIDSVLKDYFKDYDDDHPYKEALSSKSILKHYSSELDKLNNALNEALQELDALKGLQHISKNRTLPKDDNDNGGEGYQQTQTIKKTLDAYQNLLRHFRLFSPLVNKTREVLPDVNMAFYNAFEEPFVEFDRETTALYNKVRNYLSKKPFSREKFKLNFDSPTLLDGWDINQERANRSVLLIKDGKYYLAIMRPKHTDVFSNAPKDNNGDFYKKINYKLVPEANKMFPKVFFSEKGIERYSPPKDVLDAYKNGEHKKGKTFNIDSMRKIIDYFKSVVPKY
ncbi:MAG: type V CRISPR-associated protein Cas12a/Cpf1, partial [Sulfurovum sp.]|nr:type V CRISPR-associated protein Cas12a/Cpf1 [Sulfurovum sp.]